MEVRIARNDELYHWKYTYKKKVNGKWRYYYDVAPSGSSPRHFGVSKWEDVTGLDEKMKFYNETANYKKAREAIQNVPKRKKDSEEYKAAYEKYADAMANLAKARSDFMHTPMGKIYKLQSLIDKGKKAMLNVINT
jgi:hypothetical protein